MKKFLLYAITALILSSCVNKQYIYIETVDEPTLSGREFIETTKDPDTINAKNDSLAYIEAYRKFCISQYAYEMTKKKYGMAEYLSIPLRFALYDENGNIVKPISSTAILDSIRNVYAKIAYGTDNQSNKEENEIAVDSAKIKELSQKFKFKKDEFDPRSIVWVEPLSAPKYTDINSIYCYFYQIGGKTKNFRLRIQYTSDDWLFIRKYQFSIDGNAYEYIPANGVERDNGNGHIWEWSDNNISHIGDVELIKALANAKNAKIKFIGSQYHNIRTITKKEINSIKETLELYTASGGEF